jgi:uncharacterized peroxidase-related enzyme
MSRIPMPPTIEAAPAKSQPLLQAVKARIGKVLNLQLLMAVSPATLEGYIDFDAALAKGKISIQTRDRIALAVAGIDGCDYCSSVHTYTGKHLGKLDDVELAANRHAKSHDPKAAVALQFAAKLVTERGNVDDGDFAAMRKAGYDDEEIIEVIAHVAINTLTNYMNNALGTEIDFPLVRAAAA